MVDHNYFMDIAFDEAQSSADQGGVGIGAVLVKGQEVITSSGDRTLQNNNPIAVAEMECIRKAGRRNDQPELSLYSTRCPDMLTAGTLIQFSIGHLVVAQEATASKALSLLENRGVGITFLGDQSS